MRMSRKQLMAASLDTVGCGCQRCQQRLCQEGCRSQLTRRPIALSYRCQSRRSPSTNTRPPPPLRYVISEWPLKKVVIIFNDRQNTSFIYLFIFFFANW